MSDSFRFCLLFVTKTSYWQYYDDFWKAKESKEDISRAPIFYSTSLKRALVRCLENDKNWRSPSTCLWTTLKASEEEAKKWQKMSALTILCKISYFQYYLEKKANKGKNISWRRFFWCLLFVLQLVIAISEHYTCSLTTWAARCSKGRPNSAIPT